MTKYHDCEICGAYLIGPGHVCAPKWLCRDSEWDIEYDEEVEVFSHWPDTAAEAFVEKMDERSAMEYTNYGKASVTVKVRPALGGSTITYSVEPEHVLQYYARRQPKNVESKDMDSDVQSTGRPEQADQAPE